MATLIEADFFLKNKEKELLVAVAIHWLEDNYCPDDYNDTWTFLVSTYTNELKEKMLSIDSSINTDSILEELDSLKDKIYSFNYNNVNIKEFAKEFNAEHYKDDCAYLYCVSDLTEGYIDEYAGTDDDGAEAPDTCGPCDQIMYQYDRLDEAVGIKPDGYYDEDGYHYYE